MRGRLEELGVPGVRCSTFHAAALGQLRFFAAEPPRKILASKALPLRYIGNTLRRPYRFRPAADLATEIEWAKNRRIRSVRVPELARRPRAADPDGPHAPRLPRVRAAQGRPGLRRLRGPDRAGDPALRRRRGRARRRSASATRPSPSTSTRTSTCSSRRSSTAGSATGTSCAPSATTTSRSTPSRARRPEHLLAMPTRFPHATVIRLEDNYRSTPEVLEFANRLVPRLGGAEKVLRATKAEGPEPITRSFSTPELEAGFVVERIRELHEQGTPYEEMAMLFRTNARSADYEEALERGRHPVPGRGAPRPRRRQAAPEGAPRPAGQRRPEDRAGAGPARGRSRTGSASAR